ncbi:MAG TPA: hypothetical protein VGO52_19835 [Hyphomonadaceae bacterium]|jgi:hypothetical protein|nr:hypothetical protein [Hyphomonadaceae bacterium]
MGAIFGIFPLLSIPVIIYNLMAFTFSGKDGSGTLLTMAQQMGDPAHAVARIPMVSEGAVWAVTSGDLLIILSMAFFFVEILKSTSTGTATIANHAVSMIVFIICLIEFLLFKNFATSVFFILTIMSLLDVLAGVVVTIISARRDFTVGDGVGSN